MIPLFGYGCPHNKFRVQCDICNGSRGICMHGEIRSMCRECYFSELCKHNKKKFKCPICLKERRENITKEERCPPSEKFSPLRMFKWKKK